MSVKVVLVHWNESEAGERAARLERAGYQVVSFCDSKDGPAGMKRITRALPAAYVIDLGRLPSHGRAVATALRQQKSTRLTPIVFVGGAQEKVAQTRKLLPDAVYTEWRRIRATLRHAIANPPREAVAPGTMQGYSGTPLPKKLGIKADTVVMLLGAPADFEETLGALPDDVQLRRQARGKARTILLFVKSQAELARRLPGAMRAMDDPGALWIAWPKKASGVATDVSEPHVRATGLGTGLVDYKICAIDATWSGLCFARRRR